MQDEVLVMYQEAKSLSKDALPYVLRKELEMVGMVEDLIKGCVESGKLELDENQMPYAGSECIRPGTDVGIPSLGHAETIHTRGIHRSSNRTAFCRDHRI